MPEGIYTIEAGGVADVAFSIDKSKLYVALGNGTIDLIDVASQQKLATWSLQTQIGAISLTQDGSSLLVNDARQPITYRVDTASGRIANTYIAQGSAFSDVEVLDGNRALVTGSNAALLDLAAGTFSPVSGIGSALVNSDGRLSLLGATGTSDGPLYVLDETTAAIIARGNDYQSPSTGFNVGVQAISQKAGQLLQAVGRGSINVYDLNVRFLANLSVGATDIAGGLSFNAAAATSMPIC